jgi:non-homologous end joining protein Ku
MFTSVSRDIYQTKPGRAEQLIATQTVNFGRNGVEDLVTGKLLELVLGKLVRSKTTSLF